MVAAVVLGAPGAGASAGAGSSRGCGAPAAPGSPRTSGGIAGIRRIAGATPGMAARDIGVLRILRQRRHDVLHGSINHVSITVSDLPRAMEFFGPLLRSLGYTVGEVMHDSRSGHDLTVNLNEANGTAFNIWQAEPELARHRFALYEPGLHHVAFNVERREQVDELCALVRTLGGTILDGPGEFPFAIGGYYTFYCLGPDGLKLEVVHMPVAEAHARTLAEALARGRVG